MSRNALILERETLPPVIASAPAQQVQPARPAGEYLELVHRLFHDHSVVALAGVGAGSRTTEIAREVAAELAASGTRVVIVDVVRMLSTRPLPSPAACVAGHAPNVFLWPSGGGGAVEFFPSAPPAPADFDWLASLRRAFDAVLLDCPALATNPAASEIAGLADATVLVVEADQTHRSQILQDERALQRRGVKLAGCVLMQRR